MTIIIVIIIINSLYIIFKNSIASLITELQCICKLNDLLGVFRWAKRGDQDIHDIEEEKSKILKIKQHPIMLLLFADYYIFIMLHKNFLFAS